MKLELTDVLNSPQNLSKFSHWLMRDFSLSVQPPILANGPPKHHSC